MGLKVAINGKHIHFFDSCFASKRFLVLVNKERGKIGFKKYKRH